MCDTGAEDWRAHVAGRAESRYEDGQEEEVPRGLGAGLPLCEDEADDEFDATDIALGRLKLHDDELALVCPDRVCVRPV